MNIDYKSVSSPENIYPAESDKINPRRITRIKHQYGHHPMLQLDALKELAYRLMPEQKCRFIKPGIKSDSPFDHNATPQDNRSLKEVFENIEEPGSWIALYDIQTDPMYRSLLEIIRGEIQPLVYPDEKIRDIRAFAFISAPPSVTPFHIDRENNFWLQIRGHKKLTLWNHYDYKSVSAENVEKFLLFSNLHDVKLTDEIRERGMSFDCYSGDGVYFPMTTPHMTESKSEWMDGESVTISIGIVFYSNITRRHTRVNQMNYMIRKIGLNPDPPGLNDLKDRIKAITGRSLWAVRNSVSKY